MSAVKSAQASAQARNDQIEALVDYVLAAWIEALEARGYIQILEAPTRQKGFKRDDCRDIFDHYCAFKVTAPKMAETRKLELWAQTTCYKGSTTGARESNKTYEIRETLIEALGLRRWLTEEQVPFRTLHFTVGPAEYTYGWFKPAKENSFDISLYPDSSVDSERLFEEAGHLFGDVSFQYEYRDRLKRLDAEKYPNISAYISTTIQELNLWFDEGMPASGIANEQAQLLSEERRQQTKQIERAIAESKNGGAGVKTKVAGMIGGSAVSDDDAIVRTVARIKDANPFLGIGEIALKDWATWSRETFAIPQNCQEPEDYLLHMWNSDMPERLVSRRLLLRIHALGETDYPQDIGVKGITEHTLYPGDHTDAQSREIVGLIDTRCKGASIDTVSKLHDALVSRGDAILRNRLDFERKNGTKITPSFFYVAEAISESYALKSFDLAEIPAPIGYQASFTDLTVRPYTNLLVAVSKSNGKPVAIVKAKYFRKPEFARRAKEESYVGITTKYTYQGGHFVERYPGIPLIMFIDMEEDLIPPEYAVKRLATSGWIVVFSMNSLEAILGRAPSAG